MTERDDQGQVKPYYEREFWFKLGPAKQEEMAERIATGRFDADNEWERQQLKTKGTLDSDARARVREEKAEELESYVLEELYRCGVMELKSEKHG